MGGLKPPQPLPLRGPWRSRRLEVVGTRKNGPSRAPVLSFARYFQAPATQARMKWTLIVQKILTGLVVNHKNKLKHAGRSGSVHLILNR